jgi:hypothetical protein
MEDPVVPVAVQEVAFINGCNIEIGMNEIQLQLVYLGFVRYMRGNTVGNKLLLVAALQVGSIRE